MSVLHYKDFNGLYIDDETISNHNLSLFEKLYISLIKMGYSEYDTCKLMVDGGLHYNTVIKIKNSLYNKNEYVPDNKKCNTVEEAKEFTIQHSHTGQVCDWCGQSCYILHKHHYPISRKKGGKDVVNINICPNCHSTFHSIFKGV